MLKSDFQSLCVIYPIKSPQIESGSTYYFQTDSGLMYQVTFGKKKDNYLGNIVNFSVISDEYEDEYSVTNRGEVYRIIYTMIEVLRIYHQNHPYSNSYEFSGEYKDLRDEKAVSIRTRLYHRIALRVLDLNFWNVILNGNKVTIIRK